MRLAIQLAGENAEKGNGGPFGAVVVKNGEIVSACANRVTSSNDPTAHAEVVAIREACTKLNTFDLSECEIYASCEPCPMCLGAIMWARIEKLYFAASREDAAKAGFDDELFYRELSLPVEKRKLPVSQLMQQEAIHVFDQWNENPYKIEY
ncbi:MAG: nucleoside deaminase [Bacteroidales bacterium]|nr:nucleoside deaminase [Bacteroidales bacterium]MBK7175561.1 nucleoside deaminase [Bacteroidales bacterium]